MSVQTTLRHRIDTLYVEIHHMLWVLITYTKTFKIIHMSKYEEHILTLNYYTFYQNE